MKYYLNKNGGSMMAPDKHEIDVHNCIEIVKEEYDDYLKNKNELKNQHTRFIDDDDVMFFFHRKYYPIGKFPEDNIANKVFAPRKVYNPSKKRKQTFIDRLFYDRIYERNKKVIKEYIDGWSVHKITKDNGISKTILYTILTDGSVI